MSFWLLLSVKANKTSVTALPSAVQLNPRRAQQAAGLLRGDPNGVNHTGKEKQQTQNDIDQKVLSDAAF
jgi:hypothetical protein